MLLLFRGVWRPRSNTTHEFLIWLLKLFTLLLVIRGYCFRALISHALFAYEKTSEKKVSHVSALLGAETKTENKEEKLKCNRYEEKSSEGFSFLNASSFTNCDVKIFVNEKK